MSMITVQVMPMEASEVGAAVAKKPFRRVYATINGQRELVFGLRVNADSVTIAVWGDDINGIAFHQLPLDAELTVVL